MSYTSATRTTQMKNFNFDNYYTSENIFSHPYISYIANERLERDEQFHSKNYHLEMPRSHAKMCFKSATQKLNFLMAKAISICYTLDVTANALAQSRIVTYSNTASFSIKTTICETKNNLFSKNC